MSALSKLKLVAAHAEKKSPMVLRRAKLTGKIADQIAAANAAAEGSIYASKRAKFVQHSETGERKQIEIATRVKPWWCTLTNRCSWHLEPKAVPSTPCRARESRGHG